MTDPRNTPPPQRLVTGVAHTKTPSHRERDNNYADIVVQLAPRYRESFVRKACNGSFRRKNAPAELIGVRSST